MFYISIPYCNLNKIYDTGKAYRWIKVKNNDYVILHKDKAVRVRQKKDMFSFTCSEEDFYNIWYDYFDINTDYSDLHYMYRNLDKSLKPLCNRANGIRILNQDLLIVLLASLLEQKYHKNIVGSILYDISRIGKKRKNTLGGMVVGWREFPTVEQILNNKEIKHEKYYKYIVDLLSDIKDGWFDFDLLREEGLSYLFEFDYFVNEAADKVLLNGLHNIDVFPLEKDIENFMVSTFGVIYNEFIEWYTGGEIKYMNTIGYLYYIFRYNIECPIKEKNNE